MGRMQQQNHGRVDSDQQSVSSHSSHQDQAPGHTTQEDSNTYQGQYNTAYYPPPAQPPIATQPSVPATQPTQTYPQQPSYAGQTGYTTAPSQPGYPTTPMPPQPPAHLPPWASAKP